MELPDAQVELRRRLAAGDLAGVVEAGRTILRRYPRHLATYRDLAWAALLAGQDSQAGDLLRRLLSADPEDGEAWAHLARLLGEQEGRDAAAPCWTIAFDLRPWNVAEPLPVDVRAGFRRSHPQSPAVSGARVHVTAAGLGHLLARGRRWRRAAALLGPLVEQAPERLDLRSALAGALWQLGDLDAAGRLAREILAEAPSALKANMILAAGSGEEAETARRNVAALDPLGEYRARWFGEDDKA